ncbi:MAG TPA: CBS domain-containing protein [Mycobacteriales bacterium]|nr:CBS domain-containing protein [Mycobacteriales bacterium]
MRISDVLRTKGSGAHTISPDAYVTDLIAELAEHHVGALVVSGDGSTVAGIVSERDIVRRLHSAGAEVLQWRVAEIMTVDVHSAAPETLVEDLAREMTERRIRHVPVVVDGALVGIVSIGDVVKNRIDELQTERDQLEAYVRS